MKTSTGKGKTIETAIDAALKELGATRDEVEIEIIQEPTKGFLGLASKNAIVRALLRESPTPSEQQQLGTLFVKDGQLQIAMEPGMVPPSLQFGSDIRVLYNGEIMEEEVELRDGLAPLEIFLPTEQEAKLNSQVIVSPDKTKAELNWKLVPGYTYQLVDRPPVHHLRLEVQKIQKKAPHLSLQDVMDLVKIEGLKYGLKTIDITEEQLEEPEGQIILAEGEKPTPPVQPTIDYVFQEEVPQIDPDAIRIDHYEVHGIRGVKPGAILAIKKPGKPGKPGKDVYGQEIPVEELQDLEIQIGEGVTLSKDGLQAIATQTGLPVLQSGLIKVTSVFELDGDADVSTGNISMDDTIIVKGNVLENVKIESKSGDIVVNGLVSGGTLQTSGSITVLRNAIRAQLVAGGKTVLQIRVLKMLFQIGDLLEGLIVAYETIVGQAENIPFENLIKHILDLKFYNLPKHVQEFAEYTGEVERECSPELVQLRNELVKSLCGDGPLHLNDINILKNLLAKLRTQELQLEEQSAVESDVSVGYLQNSVVEASRYGEVTGKGCFYSTIMVGKGFKIPQGVVRGGKVVINSGDMVARELGGPTGIATNVEIVKEGQVTANLVHPNVSISIGEQSFRFDETTSQVKALLKRGVLTVYSGSNKIHG